MGEITGVAASSGKAVGKVFWIKQTYGNSVIPVDKNINSDEEIVRFQEAYAVVKDNLSTHAEDNEIFAAHLEILEDLSGRIIEQIEKEKMEASNAVEAVCSEVCALFAEIDDAYLRARSDDIVDVCQQIISVLSGNGNDLFSDMPSGSVIVAENLLPSDTIRIDLSKLEGIVLKKGTINSHLAILARNQGIPLVLGIGDKVEEIGEGDRVVVDGDRGRVTTQPGKSLLEEIEQFRSLREKVDAQPALTRDGTEIAVLANAGSLFDVERAVSHGAEGIGLLRTEFIFMQGTHFPDEDEQYKLYAECAKVCGERKLTIRTLDIGADKQLPYYKMDKEENPVFGLRGIRFSLAHPDIFKIQLRAILRAATDGNIRLMFPMITSMEEYEAGVALLESCKKELKEEGRPFDETLRPGIMIETPGSVLLADDFARKVPFFSIGTNDLTQYLLAVDREYPYSADAYNSFHPAVVRSIAKVVETAQEHSTDVSVCGELAGDPEATAMLLRSGVRQLSLTSHRIPVVKEQIRKLNLN